MEAIPLKMLNTGAIALINDEAVSNVVASVPSFFRGLALLASLYFCRASVIVPVPSVKPTVIADGAWSISFVISYVGGSPSVGCP